jgi:hypothetical protein
MFKMVLYSTDVLLITAHSALQGTHHIDGIVSSAWLLKQPKGFLV